MLKIIVAVAGAFVLLLQPASGGDNGKTIAENVAMGVSALEPNVTAGGALDVKITLTNKGSQTLHLECSTGWPIEDFNIEATFMDGSKVPDTALGKRMKTGPWNGSDHGERLDPGATKICTIRLSQVFDISLPGKYAFKLTRRGVRDSKGELKIEGELKVDVVKVDFERETKVGPRGQ